ncbi:hypothetical protein NKJ16_29535 [Mesorhizobium sp. M0179]|uniref:hypothetical protein n=1 Tax=unclassified Mesorhizobium TaxID=325217 RepID=UPI0003CEE4B6|nr:hypothetical protein [Mesorhizobium sp. LSJC265A00]ESX02329.1 hypothetical protein X768_30630 [Mesorhizobium sp. LSJC265A00]
MAISEDEAASLIVLIERTVREVAGKPDTQGIIDMMNQWRSDVEAGRPVERKLSVRQSPGLDELAGAPRSRTTTSGDFVGREDYSKVEQLDMLIAALGVAYVAPQMMATRFLDTIVSCSEQARQKAQFEPIAHFVGVGDTEESRAAPSISRTTIMQSREATMPLARLLDEITREAELTPRLLSDRDGVA